MLAVSSNEQHALLMLCKRTMHASPAQLSRLVGLSPMGMGKLLSRLESQRIVDSEVIGRSKRFRIRYESAYVRRFLSLLLHKEAEEAEPRVKRWIVDLRRLEALASIGILFGSVLEREARDIDAVFVTEQGSLEALRAAIDDLETLAPQPIHAVLQTREDLARNMAADRVVERAARGIVLFGYEAFVEVAAHVTGEKYGRVVHRES
jgi:DNA-binding transcriptional ArsR family regulator